MVPVGYGIFPQTFHLEICFFKCITGSTPRGNYVLCQNFDLLVWIGLLTKLRIYRVIWGCLTRSRS